MDNKIDHIIARVLSGEASPEDILYISEWLKENKENHKEFIVLQKYWNAEVSFDQYINPSISLEKLQGKINKNISRSKQHLISVFLSVAASVAIILAVSSFFILTQTQKKDKVYYTYLTNNNKSEFILCDGTKVTLNKNSRLTYPNTYGKNSRFVKLEGEAHFEVSQNPQMPFEVSLEKNAKKKGLIKVLGTIFNAKIDFESEKIVTTLIEGSVAFESADQKVKLYPNQQLIFNYNNSNIDIYEVDIEKEIAWKDGLIKYRKIAFHELVKELEKKFDTQIIIENNKLLGPLITVSGGFSEKQSLEEIMEVISRSLPIKWKKKNDIYYIR